jgi:hypothetical protein
MRHSHNFVGIFRFCTNSAARTGLSGKESQDGGQPEQDCQERKAKRSQLERDCHKRTAIKDGTVSKKKDGEERTVRKGRSG